MTNSVCTRTVPVVGDDVKQIFKVHVAHWERAAPAYRERGGPTSVLAAARTLADSLFGRHRRGGGTPRRFALVQPFAFSWKKTTLMKFIARGPCCRAAEAAWPPSDRSPSLPCFPLFRKQGLAGLLVAPRAACSWCSCGERHPARWRWGFQPALVRCGCPSVGCPLPQRACFGSGGGVESCVWFSACHSAGCAVYQ